MQRSDRSFRSVLIHAALACVLAPGWTVAAPAHPPASAQPKNDYASFRAASPPAADALTERSDDPALADACVNPANLAGGAGALKPYFAAHERGFGNTQPALPWVKGGPDVSTPFVTVPGMLSAECASNTNATYLAISVHSDPSGKRADDFRGDVFTHGAVRPRWGLHVVDVELAIGNLLEIVDAQAKTWQRAHLHRPQR